MSEKEQSEPRETDSQTEEPAEEPSTDDFEAHVHDADGERLQHDGDERQQHDGDERQQHDGD